MRNNNMLDGLFPRTRQNILAVLLLSPERRWYLSDLDLGTVRAARTVYFNICRRKRNTVDDGRAHVATETEATEILKQAKDFLTLTEAWILQNHPQFKKT